MSDVKCPYCNGYFKHQALSSTDTGQHPVECTECGKFFRLIIAPHYFVLTDCELNGLKHELEHSHASLYGSLYNCKNCDKFIRGKEMPCQS